jgi:hypothetical protein
MVASKPRRPLSLLFGNRLRFNEDLKTEKATGILGLQRGGREC